MKGLQQVTSLSLVLALCLLLWFLPVTHNACVWLDQKLALYLNQSLNIHKYWQNFWAYLNHKNENWLNVIWMLSINLGAILTIKGAKPKKIALQKVIYFWMFFQFVLIFSNYFFMHWLELNRYSPSVVLSPWLKLSKITGIKHVKDESYRCFPAGHTLVAVYWGLFSASIFNNRLVKTLIIISATLLIMSRLISGAHWPSDAIFTAIYAGIWFYVAAYIPIIKKLTKQEQIA